MPLFVFRSFVIWIVVFEHVNEATLINSCIPKWVYNCVGRDKELRVASHGCDGQLWNACPSWSQWTFASSLRFWTTPSEFRFRACPRDCSQLARPGSRIFKSDRSTGHVPQVQKPGHKSLAQNALRNRSLWNIC